MKLFSILKSIKKKIGNRINSFLYSRFTKYVVDYKIEGENLRIYTNLGNSRVVKNTKENQKKLNKVIVQNKLSIASKIDEYERTSEERLIVLIINISLLGIAGVLVPLTFFIGSYIIFILSIFLFSFLSLAVSLITTDYFILVEEIKKLKQITGYKKDMEFNLPKISLKKIKYKIEY